MIDRTGYYNTTESLAYTHRFFEDVLARENIPRFARQGEGVVAKVENALTCVANFRVIRA